jgi:YidC/Oxa1 family membrane protein insertase
MEKRALIAVVISLVILLVYQVYFAPPPPPPGAEKPAAEKSAPPGKEAPEKAASSAGQKAAPAVLPPSPAPAPAQLKSQPGKNILVETPLYTAVFDTRGARLKDWKVKQYSDKLGAEGKPIDLAAVLSGGYPLGLEMAEANFPFSAETNFQINTDKLQLGPGNNKGELLFTWTSPDGLRILQQMTFYADSYRVDFNLQMINSTSKTFEARPLLAWFGKIFPPPGGGGMACIPGSGGGSGTSVPPFTALVNKELHEVELKDVTGEKRFTQNVQWGGFQDTYFLAALAPQKSAGTELILRKTADTTGDLLMGGPKASLPPNTQFAQSYAIYMGPKDLDLLKKFNYDLDKALDFGWFDIIAKPMLYVLKFFHNLLGNWGLAIIILTIIIKIIFWYPTHISYKSMKEMKKVQPEMAKLRAKFKDDKERLNKEMMDLYRRYKVNPMSGCLPMVIQIPIFFALYKVLLYSIEIRQAPFYWWIHDLSAPDPYYISPILMGASMFAQQWLTPTTGDPTQAKMMLMMPVVFTFMFLNFPTGLVIYWLFNNLLSIGQQLYINKYST